MRAERTQWEARYSAGERTHDGPASGLLRRWLPRLPGARAEAPERLVRGRPRGAGPGQAAYGRALDVATGLGRNALHLARAGYRVDAVDISPTALREARRRARRAGLRGIHWIAADLDGWRPPRGTYDIVVNSFFLKRGLFPALRAAVRPGGVLIFEAHLTTPGPDGGPRRRAHRLRAGELRRKFRDWDVLYARDGGCREGGRMWVLGRIVARRPRRRRSRR